MGGNPYGIVPPEYGDGTDQEDDAPVPYGPIAPYKGKGGPYAQAPPNTPDDPANNPIDTYSPDLPGSGVDLGPPIIPGWPGSYAQSGGSSNPPQYASPGKVPTSQLGGSGTYDTAPTSSLPSYPYYGGQQGGYQQPMLTGGQGLSNYDATGVDGTSLAQSPIATRSYYPGTNDWNGVTNYSYGSGSYTSNNSGSSAGSDVGYAPLQTPGQVASYGPGGIYGGSDTMDTSGVQPGYSQNANPLSPWFSESMDTGYNPISSPYGYAEDDGS